MKYENFNILNSFLRKERSCVMWSVDDTKRSQSCDMGLKLLYFE
jgi:hypothetical protein